MTDVSVLFVDDEEDIRFSFEDRFEDDFSIRTAADGVEAMKILRTNPDINVVVTDLRMPEMDGLELIRHIRDHNPEMGVIVVSGHADTDDIIVALRRGARNYLRKPYDFAELRTAIVEESARYHFLVTERARQTAEKATDQFVTAIKGVTFELPVALSWVDHLAFRLARNMETLGVCTADNGPNVALGLVELLTNAVEHGSLEITGPEKKRLKSAGEDFYQQEMKRRMADDAYRNRVIRVEATMTPDEAVVRIEDQGPGFDVAALPNPTLPENIFAPNGRGLLLARAFLDDVQFSHRGNVVTLTKVRPPPEE